MAHGFEHVDVWVFDLDNTLYPPTCGLFPEIDRRIRAYVAGFLGVDEDEAYRVQKRYFREHGTTLSGLIENHAAEPRAFLDYVHDIDLSAVAPDPALGEALGRLPGRKIVFTNADARHAARVLDRLGVQAYFDAVFDIEAADWVPKPNAEAYRRLVAAHGVDPASAVLVEDLPRNLAPAAALGMTTVWVKNGAEWATSAEGAGSFAADHVVEELGAWLAEITAGAG